MKTGMGLPLVVLVFALVLVVLWNIWGGYQVEIAAAQVQATAVGGTVTAPAMLGAQMIVKAIIGLLFGGVITAAIGYGVAWLRRQTRSSWQSGPNARWQTKQQPAERSLRGPSETELYRAMLMQQVRATGGQARPDWSYKQEDEDEPVFRI